MNPNETNKLMELIEWIRKDFDLSILLSSMTCHWSWACASEFTYSITAVSLPKDCRGNQK
jgi:hypothetical protein